MAMRSSSSTRLRVRGPRDYACAGVPWWRVALLAGFLAAFVLGGAGLALGQILPGQERYALVGEVDGAINAVTQRYIERVVSKGVEEQAEIVIFELDTPGGTLAATEKIVEALLEDRVPTAVYVSPRGAFAGSAGTFITAAAQFAVMAPGAGIGAASPVGPAGEDLPPTLSAKVQNAVDALVRSVADVRGRNGEELSKTVTEAKTFTALEAAQLGVVDYVAEDLSDLLRLVDGKTVTLKTLAGDEVSRRLQTEGIAVQRADMTLIEQFLFFLANPDVSFLLLSIGGLGLVIELFNPGVFVPAIVGIVCLVLAFLSVGALPVNWAGVALILLAMGLLAGELLVAGFGVLGIGALVCFVLGGLVLFSGQDLPDAPDIGVNPWLLGAAGGTIFVAGWYVFWTIGKSRKSVDVRGRSTLVGEEAVVIDMLAPRGRVRIHDELWSAVVEGSDVVEAGQSVTVLRVDGTVLTVTPVEKG